MPKKKEHIADVIDFSQIFKVAERPGLWTPRSEPSMHGFVGIRKFLSEEIRIANIKKMQPLSNLVFYNNSAKGISFKQVFKNMFDWETKHGKELVEIPIHDAMEIAVPDFDADEFKPHHMHKVFDWFQIIIKTLKDGRGNIKKNKIKNQKSINTD